LAELNDDRGIMIMLILNRMQASALVKRAGCDESMVLRKDITNLYMFCSVGL